MLAPLMFALSVPVIRRVLLVFWTMGCVFGSWATYIPRLKAFHELNEAQMGLLLLALPSGAIIMNPISISLMHRFGERKLILLGLVSGIIGFYFAFLSPHIYLATLSLFFTGMLYSGLNMAINTYATAIERREQRHILSSGHGFWSLGAMSGAMITSISIRYLDNVVLHYSLLLASIIILTLFLWRDGSFLDISAPMDRSEKPKLKRPNKMLWILITISLCTNLVEGTMADWSAIYLKDMMSATDDRAGLGFSAYAVCMAGGRFFGDFLQNRFGSMKMLVYCGVIALSGMMVIIFGTTIIIAIVGCAMVGAGVSLGAPILYAASTRVPGYGKGVGLATLNTFAMFGFLGGPAIIGLIAQATSLPLAFMFVSGMCILWWLMSLWAKRLEEEHLPSLQTSEL